MERLQAAFTRTVELSEPPAGTAPAPPARTTAAATPTDARAAASAQAASAAAARAERERQARRAREAAARQAAEAAEAAGSSAAPSDAARASELVAAAPEASAPAELTPRQSVELAPPPGASVQASAAAGAMPASAVAAAASAPIGPAFSWPASTRLEYKLKGWYRGDVEGTARVEWLRDGERYQTHLEVFIGPQFAPLVTRRMSSEGLVTPNGLVPRRYEQVTKQVFGNPRVARMQFDADGITLAGGQRVPPLAEVQDTASQFIQMIYLFSTQPELRTAGRSVEIGLALPNRADRWVYEVGPLAIQDTPAGRLEAFHVRPRRAAAAGDLSVEIWYAPRLAMLPVRFRIRQDAETYVDLFLDHAPVQAGP
jgi:hypothetical protein